MSKKLLPLLGLLLLPACAEPPMGPSRPDVQVPVTQEPPRHPDDPPKCVESTATGLRQQAVQCEPLF